MTQRITARFIFLSLFLASFLQAKEIPVVPIDKEPAHHQVLDNEYVRVFDVVVAPHASTLMHRHDRDYIFVILGDADISNELMNEKPAHAVLKDGDARYSKGGFAHVARNLAETPFHNITVELKNPGKAVCGIDPNSACQNEKLFSTEHVSVHRTTIESGQQGPSHTHSGPHLTIAIDDLTLENHVPDKPVAMISMKKGEFKWLTFVGTHNLKNIGNSRGRLFSIEFK
jgi:quercetin dioxygenase-like cupin family protein